MVQLIEYVSTGTFLLFFKSNDTYTTFVKGLTTSILTLVLLYLGIVAI